MTTLVVGASGATGQLLVAQLLHRGEAVRAVLRPASRLPPEIENSAKLSIVYAQLSDLDDAEMMRLVEGCDAVASCLGHRMSFKGIYGRPHRLVTDAVRRLCRATRTSRPANPVRFVLMNSAGCRNRDLQEPVSFAQSCVVWLLRALLPPHRDNETAADYLRAVIGQADAAIEWAAVRPDSLIDADEVTACLEHDSPLRSAIFDAGRTSRINVADFICRLITDDASWQRWKGRMPVLYNRD